MLMHDGGGIIFGYGVDTPTDIAVFRPSPGTTTPNAPGISINSFIGPSGVSANTFRVNMPSAFVGVEGQELFAVDTQNKVVRVARGEAGFTGSESFRAVRAVRTTDASAVTLATIALDTPRAYTVVVRVVARQSTGTNRALIYKAALVFREGGSATLQGSPQDVIPAIKSGGAGGWDCIFTPSGNNILSWSRFKPVPRLQSTG